MTGIHIAVATFAAAALCVAIAGSAHATVTKTQRISLMPTQEDRRFCSQKADEEINSLGGFYATHIPARVTDKIGWMIDEMNWNELADRQDCLHNRPGMPRLAKGL